MERQAEAQAVEILMQLDQKRAKSEGVEERQRAGNVARSASPSPPPLAANQPAAIVSSAHQLPGSRSRRPPIRPLIESHGAVPAALVEAWRAQLAEHQGTQPVWIDRCLLRRGTLVADTLASLGIGHGIGHGIGGRGMGADGTGAHGTGHGAGPALADYAGVELWAQRRPPESPMHLHFDCDEARCPLP